MDERRNFFKAEIDYARILCEQLRNESYYRNFSIYVDELEKSLRVLENDERKLFRLNL